MKFKKLVAMLLSLCCFFSMSMTTFADEIDTSKNNNLTEYTHEGITFSVPADWICSQTDESTLNFMIDSSQTEPLISIFSTTDLSFMGMNSYAEMFYNQMKSGILETPGMTVTDQFDIYELNTLTVDRFYANNNGKDVLVVLFYNDNTSGFATTYCPAEFTWDTARKIEKVIASIKPIKSDDSNNNVTESTTASESISNNISAAELEALLLEQPMYVSRTEYIVQDERYKALYPDMLSAVLYNNSGTNIKNAVVGFVAWDANNFPIKIVGQYDFSGGDYVSLCDFGDVNMIPGSTFGESMGMPIDDDDQKPIATFKAIVYQYTDFDGNVWTNPYYETWCNLYENKMLAQ